MWSIPRWLSGFGVGAAAVGLFSSVLFFAADVDWFVLGIPAGLFELVIGIWLIVNEISRTDAEVVSPEPSIPRVEHLTVAEMPDLRSRLSTLWIVVMFNMLFADVLTLYIPEYAQEVVSGTTPVEITEELMLAMAVFIEIPIAMIFLSLVLGTPPTAERTSSPRPSPPCSS